MDIKLKNDKKIAITIKNKNYSDYIINATKKYCFDIDIEQLVMYYAIGM